MSYVITLIAPSQAPILEGLDFLKKATTLGNPRVLSDARAIDIEAAAPVANDLMDEVRERFHVDIICQHKNTRTKKLFIADMDATMVEEETLDELAAHAGIKDKIAAITTRAMNGELDFQDALRERVALLKNLPASALQDTAEKMHFTPGGKKLLTQLKANNVHCILVSGGFTFFTSKVAETLGFDENYGNTLHVEDGLLTGTVGEPILDKNFKKSCLEKTAEKLKIPITQTIAIGDGANDLPMLQTAGLGIGFHSKPLLRQNLSNHLLYNDLDTLIPVLGL